MGKKILLLVIYISALNLYSDDGLISERLYSTYGDDITIEQINRVLEYDQKNENALIKKANYFDSEEFSLYKTKKILEDSGMSSLDSRLQYISVLYRLTDYKALIDYSNSINYKTIDSSNTLYYIADSYLRLKLSDQSIEIIAIARHQFPNDVRFLELLYLITTDRKLLSNIQMYNNQLESLMRIYNRVDEPIAKLTVEVLLESLFNNIEPSLLSNYMGNYPVLSLLFKSVSSDQFNGLYFLDSDSDTFKDTYYRIVDGVIEYKGYDEDRDNVIDKEIYLDGGVPNKIVINNNSIVYSNYPYIDYIVTDKEERVVFDLYKNYYSKILSPLTERTDWSFDIDNLTNLKLIAKKFYKGDILYKKNIYKDNHSQIQFSQLNSLGAFDECTLTEDNKRILGLRDLDSDGVYDLCNVYKDGIIVGYAYSKTGKKEDITFIESNKHSAEYILEQVNFKWW